jgi:hypothetical protein
MEFDILGPNLPIEPDEPAPLGAYVRRLIEIPVDKLQTAAPVAARILSCSKAYLELTGDPDAWTSQVTVMRGEEQDEETIRETIHINASAVAIRSEAFTETLASRPALGSGRPYRNRQADTLAAIATHRNLVTVSVGLYLIVNKHIIDPVVLR